MILVNELKAMMVKNGMTQSEVADKLGITATTMSRKMQKGVFDSNEINAMIEILGIENPAEIFFAKEVNYKLTNRK